MLTRVLEKIVDLIVEKFLGGIVALWKKSKLRALGVGVGVFAIVGFSAGAIVLAPLVPYMPFTWLDDDLPVRRADRIRLESLQERVASDLIIEANKLVMPSGEEDVWTYADIIAGLDPDFVASKLRLDHVAVFQQFVRTPQQCWTSFRRSPTTHEPCHIGMTSWILLSLVNVGIRAEPQAWRFLFDEQHSDGWWAVYERASNNVENASSFATAITLHAIAQGLNAHLLPDSLVSEAQARIDRASSWLINHRESGCLWADYPNRPQEKRTFLAISGLAIFALDRARVRGLDEIKEACIATLSQQITSISEQEASLLLIVLDDKQTINDQVRHQKLIWMAIGLATCYPSASLLDKARIRRFVGKSLFSATPTPDHELHYAWQRGELALMTRLLTASHPH